ncbi:hypothetical protein [Campylobacter sputorum]|uniref:hypothetical protein n=1 Tax=Campylobacter sputorum TaxID=206 RepID=UPI00053BE2D2|nr:hypothetical protein [Campylobacter sputorum]
MKTIEERILLIDLAIDSVLDNLQNGIEIKEYWIDNVKIQKRSPFELIEELRKMRSALKKDAKKSASCL